MTKIELGQYVDTRKKFSIDLEKLIDTRYLIMANSGAGKTYLVRKIVEEAIEKGVMIIIFDIEGEFYTLREKYNILIIGGKYGDIPISLLSAPLLPKKLIELRIPTIIDFSDLKKGERIQYVKKFLDEQMELPQEYRMPMMTIISEAHHFCGEQEKQDSTWAVIDLMTRGRKRGFMGGLDTQRIAKLHKDAVAEANNYFVGRTYLDIDMKRSADIIGFSRGDYVEKLRNLEDGEFWAFGRAMEKGMHRVQIGKCKTTHPKVGVKLRIKIAEPTEKIKKMLEKLSDLPKQAEKERLEKADLQKRIHELEVQLRSQPKTKEVNETDLNRIEQNVRADAEKKMRDYEKQLETAYNNQINTLTKLANEQGHILANIGTLLDKKVERLEVKMPRIEIPKIEYKTPIRTWQSQASSLSQRHDKIKIPEIPEIIGEDSEQEKRLHQACPRAIYKFLHSNNHRPFSTPQIAIMTGYSPKSSGYINAISLLNVSGLVKKHGRQLEINQAKVSEAYRIYGDYLNEPEEFSKKNILRKLATYPRKIVEILYENPENEFTRSEIASMTKYSENSSGFINAISTLNVMGLIQKNQQMISLSEEAKEL